MLQIFKNVRKWMNGRYGFYLLIGILYILAMTTQFHHKSNK